MSRYLRYFGVIENDYGKNINKITVKMRVKNATGNVKVTDLMLQEGNGLTGHTINSMEMLKSIGTKHYNILVRGSNNGIIVNNSGELTTGLNFDIRVNDAISGEFNLETFYKTKEFKYFGSLQIGQTLYVDAFKYKVIRNARLEDMHNNKYLTIPSGEAIYTVNMKNRDGARFTFHIKEYDKGKPY